MDLMQYSSSSNINESTFIQCSINWRYFNLAIEYNAVWAQTGSVTPMAEYTVVNWREVRQTLSVEDLNGDPDIKAAVGTAASNTQIRGHKWDSCTFYFVGEYVLIDEKYVNQRPLMSRYYICDWRWAVYRFYLFTNQYVSVWQLFTWISFFKSKWLTKEWTVKCRWKSANYTTPSIKNLGY